VDGQRYAIRPGSTLQRGAGGTAADWSYGTQGALSFLIELRPTSGSEGGFVLPPEQIVPTCEDSLAAVLELADWVISHR
jgi:carboxypeptidase T